jgi:hypothetical protein
MRRVERARLASVFALCCGVAACGDRNDAPAGGAAGSAAPASVQRADVERVLDSAFERVGAVADSVDGLFRPVPLLTPAQEAAFRRFGNAQQLERARALGVRPASEAERRRAVDAGRLLVLEDSTEHWVVRELTHSEPLLTPDARALLVRIGERFHARLDAMGAPRYRLEVTSVLRTAESQAELRRTNPNAAAGQSTHEYGTTIDIAYASFAAPAELRLELDATDAEWLRPRLERLAAAQLETVAARNSLELRAILGLVMLELQSEGVVMVTLERLQPVYHFTVARRLAG